MTAPPAWTAIALGATAVVVVIDLAPDRSGARSRLGVGAVHAPRTVPMPPVVDAALRRSGSEHPGPLWQAWVAALTVSGLAAAVWPPARLLLGGVVLGPLGALAATGDRALRRRRRQLPVALDAVAAALRGGASLADALGAAHSAGAPIGTELTALRSEHRNGRSLTDALAGWRDADGDPDRAVAGSALVVAARVGGPGAQAIDAAARSLRDRHAADAEITAMATQARLSALVLTVTPIAFAMVLVGLDDDAAHFLTGTVAGWCCVAIGLSLDAVGGWWMHRLVRSAS